MMKNLKIIIGSILITLLIISMSGCLSDGAYENESKDVGINQSEPKENYTEENEKIMHDVTIEKVEDIELNSKPSFEIGHKYFYRSSPLPVEKGYYFEEEVFTIKGKQRINKTDYYIITRDVVGYISPNPDITSAKHFGNNITTTWYCDEEEGKCIGKNTNPEKYSDENMFVTDSSMFAYWMLGLKENLKWNMYLNGTEETMKGRYLKLHIKYEFEVVGKEKVNNIECFKVKMKYINTDTKKVRYVRYYWIDVKRRILIKKEQFEDGIKMYEINLIKEA